MGRCECADIANRWSGCATIGVFVDEATRMVECRKCGAQIEAFDYLWALATEGEMVTNDLVRLKEQIRVSKAQVSLLEDEIRSLKVNRNSLKRAKEA